MSWRDATVRPLTPDDGPSLERFFAELEDYEELFGEVESSAAVVTYLALPEGKTYDDKYLLGVWHEERIVGTVDLVTDYPEKQVWTIGLLVLNSDFRGRGLGSALLAWLEAEARKTGAEALRVVARAYNSRCIEFLSQRGFSMTVRPDERENVVLERSLDTP